MTHRQALTEVEELRSPDSHPYTSYQILYEALEGTAAKLLVAVEDAEEAFGFASQEKERYAKILTASSQALDKAEKDLEVLDALWATHKDRMQEWFSEQQQARQ